MVKSLIICEGKNDKEFLKLLIEYLNITNVDIMVFGNKSNIFKSEKYSTILEEIGTIYKNLLVIFDSDFIEDNNIYGGYENSEREIRKLFVELNIEKIADFYIVCDPISKNGYLESLILSTIPQSEKNCITNFLKCSKFKDKEQDKAILNRIYKLGYPESPYDFAHKHFDTLKNKLQKLK